MELKKLTLRNFKGIQAFMLNPDGNSIIISGDNRAGKTTVADAIYWLLFGKDSLGQTTFEIKTLVDGVPVPKLQHEVEGVFQMGERVVKLKRVYYEKWVGKRGKNVNDKVFSGHTTDYLVDDVPVSASSFKKVVEDFGANEDVLSMLMSPTVFSGLPWQKKREILFEACGEITDEEVISGNSIFSELPKILEGKTVSERKKILAAQRKKINAEMESIPARIDEQDRSRILVESNVDLEAKANEVRNLLALKLEAIASIKSGGMAGQLQAQALDIGIRLSEIEMEVKQANWKKISGLEKEKSELESQKAQLLRNAADTRERIAQKETSSSRFTKRLEQLRNNFNEMNQQKAEVDLNCPTCGHELDPIKIVEARKVFNEKKAICLADINREGSDLSATLKTIIAEVEELQGSLRVGDDVLAEIEKMLAGVEHTIEVSKDSSTTVSDFPEWMQLMEKRNALALEMTTLEKSTESALDALDSEVAHYQGVIRTIETDLSFIAQSEAIDKRIDELREQEKMLAKEFGDTSRVLDILESFEREKCLAVEEKINSKFSMVTFRLFRDQLNDGIQPVCDIMVEGVPFGSLNHASRVQAGLDIINTLAGFYGVRPFVVIDGRESVTWLPEINAQVISLVVSKGDDLLRVVNA